FDNPAPGVISDKRYETAVSLAASVAWHFSAEQDTDISFASQGFVSSADLYSFLAFLALVEPSSDQSVIDSLRPSDDYNIIFTTRPRGTIPTALWACSYFVFLKD